MKESERIEMYRDYHEADTPDKKIKVQAKWFWSITKWEVRDNLLKNMYSDALVEALIYSSPPTEVEYRERLVKMLEHSRKNG